MPRRHPHFSIPALTLSTVSLLGALAAGCGSVSDGPVTAGSNRQAPADGGSVFYEPDGGQTGTPDGQDTSTQPVDRILREGAVGTVSLVIDGDTLHVTIDGWYHRVRIQGVNAPECLKEQMSTDDGRHFVCTADDEWWGLSGYQALNEHVTGLPVTVHCDQQPGDPCPTDAFDRFLAFVETDEGDVGEWLARNGHAMSFTKFSSSRRSIYCAAEDQAIAEGLGMWGLGDRDEVLSRMSAGTQDWYRDRDARCAEALRGE